MFAIFDNYVLRESDGTYAAEWPAFLAISCVDGPDLDPAAVAALRPAPPRRRRTSARRTSGSALACSYWPDPPVNAAPTPVVGAQRAADRRRGHHRRSGHADRVGRRVSPRELGARLITVEGTTHTSSLDGNPCLDGR